MNIDIDYVIIPQLLRLWIRLHLSPLKTLPPALKTRVISFICNTTVEYQCFVLADNSYHSYYQLEKRQVANTRHAHVSPSVQPEPSAFCVTHCKLPACPIFFGYLQKRNSRGPMIQSSPK